MGQSKDDGIASLKQSMVEMKAPSEPDGGLHRLLKFGTSTNHWNEFVFLAYHDHQADAIFLAGIPELRTTLPHAWGGPQRALRQATSRDAD